MKQNLLASLNFFFFIFVFLYMFIRPNSVNETNFKEFLISFFLADIYIKKKKLDSYRWNAQIFVIYRLAHTLD